MKINNYNNALELFNSVKKASEEGDDEMAHALEDDLRYMALKAVVSGDESASLIVDLALKTEQFKFARWCA